MLKRFLTFLVLLFSASLLWSQENGAATRQTPTAVENGSEASVSEADMPLNLSVVDNRGNLNAGVGWRQVFSLFFGLLLVAFFLFLLFRYFKGLSKPTATPAGGFFRLIASESLFGSRYVHILKAGNSYYFLASADNEVSLLEKIEDPEMIQSIELYVSTMPSEAQTFWERLLGAVQKTKIRVSVDESARKVTDGFKKQSDKLNKM